MQADTPRLLAANDATAPSVLALTVSPGAVDTASSAALISATVQLHDDLSGLSIGGAVPLTEIRFVSPSGSQTIRGWFSHSNRVSGDPLDGSYRTTVSVAQYSEPGHWNVSLVTYDQAGNTRTYEVAELAASGFGNGFDQSGSGDTTAPSVASFSVTPTTVDTSLSSQALTIAMRLSDDLSGVSLGTSSAASSVTLVGPTGSHTVSASLGFAQRVSGSALDGFYATTTSLGRWSEQGIWTVQSLSVRDNVGNSRVLTMNELVGASFQTSFIQVGNGDIVAPRFRSFTVTPSSLDTSTGPALAVFRARITDATSGVATGASNTPSEVLFVSTSGEQKVIAQFGSSQRVSGDVFDGWYEFAVTLPPGSEQGIWTLAHARPVDAARNFSQLTATDWGAAGFPVSFEVRSDGTPSAPRNVIAVKSGIGGATISWLEPSVIGSTAIVGYEIIATPGGRSVEAGPGASGATISGLADGVTYTFVVRANNAAGPGSWSAPSNALRIGDIDDLTAPVLVSLIAQPVVVQTTTAPAVVELRIGVNDDASGLTGDSSQLSTITVVSPSSTSTHQARFGAAEMVAGNALSGSYVALLTLPQGSEIGPWTIQSIQLRDVSGHLSVISTADLVAASRPSVIVVQTATVASVPRSVSAAGGMERATVSWLPPATDGNAFVTGYVVTSSPGGHIASVSGGSTNAIVTGLTNGTQYTFTVRALNAIGTSAPSSPSNAVTPGGSDVVAPSLASFTITPSQLTSTSSTQAVAIMARVTDAESGVADANPLSTVSFARPDMSDAGLVVFGAAQLIAGTSLDGTFRSDFALEASPLSGSWPVTGVVLRDRAGNQVTIAPNLLATAGFATGFSVVGQRVPDAPTHVSATTGSQSATLTWLAPTDQGSSPISSYTIMSTPAGFTMSVPASTTTVVATGLTNGLAYSFTVVATNSSGQSPASQPSNSVTPGGPDTGAPALVALSVDPPLIDTEVAPSIVNVVMRVTDAVSGLTDVAPTSSLLLRSPSGVQTEFGIDSVRRTNGTSLDGSYLVVIDIAQYSEQGAWVFAGLVLRDVARNQIVIAEVALGTLGFPTGFLVSGSRVPDAPSNVECRFRSGGIDVSWAPPTDSGSSAIVSYTVTAVPDGFVQTSTVTHLTFATLTFGRTYTFSVRATNSTGTSAASVASAACAVGLVTASGVGATRPVARPAGGVIDDARDAIATS